ncbi:hypothetical protein J2S11_001132 [Bacillus horti]|uniref:DUF4190 domain-containing protein n=1 Tax=Caldalkalibacillus horti TaxID=77523 RepID=A0ABT9VW55_9BACI|nr:hypothetical protein [Bacillus horti]
MFLTIALLSIPIVGYLFFLNLVALLKKIKQGEVTHENTFFGGLMLAWILSLMMWLIINS